LAAVAGTAEARGCGTMKAPGYMGMPMHPGPHHMHRAKPHGAGYAAMRKGGPSVLAVAKRTGDFATLLTAVNAAGLGGLLEGDGPYTLFAPTDAAFEKLPEGALQELLGDPEKLTALLKYHVVPGRFRAADVLSSASLTTASGQELPTNDLGVVRADVRARNGVIHVVDKVLLPSR
jgi:uncharacterized surface protein with fasciclin (FAS1) repeats